jgi:serine/threonine protein kinase
LVGYNASQTSPVIPTPKLSETISPITTLAHYTILSKIGAGGMGEVYRARDTRLDPEVAIKVLPALYTRDPDRLTRFEQEARATSALNHPNIPTVYDIGKEAGSPYIVAELLSGAELREQLDVAITSFPSFLCSILLIL